MLGRWDNLKTGDNEEAKIEFCIAALMKRHLNNLNKNRKTSGARARKTSTSEITLQIYV